MHKQAASVALLPLAAADRAIMTRLRAMAGEPSVRRGLGVNGADWFERWLIRPSGCYAILGPDGAASGACRLKQSGWDGTAYVSYWIGSERRGQGSGTGGVRQALQAAGGVLGLRRVKALVRGENAASHALLRRLGFVCWTYPPQPEEAIWLHAKTLAEGPC